MSTTVFVSGANGFIAKQIVFQLLEKNYKVIGSVRTAAKGDIIKKQFNSENFSYVVIPDLEDPEAFKVIADHPEITVFLHTASPFSTSGDIHLFVGPAVKGTKNALSAINKYGKNIKNVVLTSSVASIWKTHDTKPTYNEKDWNDVTEEDAIAANGGIVAYCLSKTAAERAAWDFVETEKPHFRFATILPSFVFGPQAFDDDVKDTLNASSEVINSVFTKGETSFPILDGSFIDVRDVAKAHIVAFEKNLHQRLITSNTAFTLHDVIELLKTQYPNRKFPVVEQGQEIDLFNSEVSRKALGFEYIDFKKTILDTAAQIAANQ